MANNDEQISLSIIIPVYREKSSLLPIYERFKKCIGTSVTYEIIFVNDGNRNNDVTKTLEELRKLPHVRIVQLARNFGQHIAIAAGLKNSRGAYCMMMDADLQYNPEDAWELYKFGVNNNYGAVISVIKKRTGFWLRKLASKGFYWIMEKMGAPQRNDIGSLFLISRHVARGVLRIQDRHRLTIPMVYWLSGDIAYFEVAHQARESGRSGYTLFSNLQLLLNGVTSFSARPLYASFVLSFAFAIAALAMSAELIYEKIWKGQVFLTGWLSTVLLVLISSSLILFCLGVIGLYLGRVFESVRMRPLYFVQTPRADEDVKLFED